MVVKAVGKLLNIQPAIENPVTIQESLTYEGNALKNKIWYRGDPSELDQFFKRTANDSVSKSRFWAASPTRGLSIRKIHSGLPSMIVDKISDIVVADIDNIEVNSSVWDEIREENMFDELVGESIAETLVVGDGAFKITIDNEISKHPIIEFIDGGELQYVYKRGRLQEIVFYSNQVYKNRTYKLEEHYGRGYIKYKLLNDNDKEVPLSTIPGLNLLDVTYESDFMMAVPLKFFKSPKWEGRGKSIYDTKSDNFDKLDETISQWTDAVRDGRVQKYIPEDLIPRNPDTGELMQPNSFDNKFIKVGSSLSEDAKEKIDMIQPSINYEAFVNTYASDLDMCLQGIISPSTLGIDLKKTDNAESQREKEKTTLYTRGKVIDSLTKVIPQVIDVVLKTEDILYERVPGDYEASIKFGEYASPSFDTVVETVGKAKQYGVMSIEKSVEELYGDTMTDEEKIEEIKRIKEQTGIITLDEPEVGLDNE